MLPQNRFHPIICRECSMHSGDIKKIPAINYRGRNQKRGEKLSQLVDIFAFSSSHKVGSDFSFSFYGHSPVDYIVCNSKEASDSTLYSKVPNNRANASNVAGMSQEKLFDGTSKVEISKYYVIFVYFQAAVSALLAVSVLYVEKKSK